MAYVYQHIRLDTNEIFYIGIGEDKKRLYSHKNRNIHWKRIVKNHGFLANVIIENCTWEEACNTEKELIKIIGRKDLKLGPLVNMTDGGEGSCGLILSKETKNKIAISMLGDNNVMKNPEIAKKVSNKLKFINTIRIDRYSINNEFIDSFYSIHEASRITKIATSSISKCCKGKLNTAGKYIWKYSN